MELLISGFAIFGLFQVMEPLSIKLEIAQITDQDFYVPVLMLALISCAILIVTLLLHIVLRGLWIGALGLRYVSGDIDFKELNYTPKFRRYLRRRIGSFDKYISKLEDGCSVLFALSFLLIFYMISIFLVFGSIILIIYFFLDQDEYESSILLAIGVGLLLFILIGMFLVFIDFLTQGFLKKKKWLAFIYWTFYWVFSYITLTFLYRPLVYNFLDNRFGRIISIALVPIYVGVIYLVSLEYTRSNFMSTETSSSEIFANVSNYDTVLEDEGQFVRIASIPNKVITEGYLPIFIEYRESIESRVLKFNPELELEEDRRGFGSRITFSDTDPFEGKRDSLRREYMKTLKDIHVIKIDTLFYSNFDFVFTKNINNQEGFETVISLDSIKSGKHLLKIYRKNPEENKGVVEIDTNRIANIPFWYYPKD